MATNTLHIRVRSDGTRVVGKNIKGIGEAANVASRQIFIMRRAIKTLIAAAGVRAGFRAIEQFTELNNKLKTVTSTTQELIRVRKSLLKISNDSRTALSANVQLYARTTRAVAALGLSEAKRLKFTALLTKEAVVGGATTIEATNAIRQLTQGMGAAGLKGEELRSVLEQLPTVAQRIADFMGVAQSELRKLGEEGKLTGEVVVAAMLAAETSIEKAFGETVSTVGQSFEVLKNSFTEFIGNVDKFTGGSKALAGALRLVARNLEIISALLVVIVARAAFVSLANNGLTLASAIALAGSKLATFARSLFVVGAAAPAIKSVTNSFLAMTAARSVATTSAAAVVPTVAGLSVATILGVYAAMALLVGVLLTAATRQNSFTNEVEKAAQAERDLEEAIRKRTLAQGLTFDGEGPQSQIQKDVARRSTDPFIRLRTELPDISKKVDVLRAAILSLKSEQFGLDIIKTSGTEKQIQAATERVEKTKQALDDVKKSFSDVNLAATKDMSIATVMRDAETAAKGFGGEMAGLQRLAEGLVNLLDRSQLTQLTPDEKKGTESQQTAAKVAEVVSRIQELKNAYAENTLTIEDYNQGLAVNKEKLDELTGSSSAMTSQLVAENAIFNKFGGDLEAISMRLAGATEEQVKAFLAAKKAREALTNAQQAAIAAEKAAEAAERRNTDAINGTLDALREKLRLFGLVGRARERAEFQSLNPNADQLGEFDNLTRTLEQKGISAGIQEQIAEFKASASALNEAVKTAKENAAKLGPEKLKEVNEDLIRGKDALEKAAVALANSIAADLGTAGEKSIEEIRAALVAGAGTIGTQAGTALITAFKAAVLGAVPGLNSLLPPGVPGGEASTPEQDAQRDANAQAFQAANEAAKRATDNITKLNENARLFGPTMQASAQQGGSALKNFGDSTQSIGQELQSTFSSIFGSLEDALVSFVTTGKLDFKSLINSIIADLARMVIRMLIIQPLMGFFSGFFGGIFGFSGGGSVGGAFGLPGFDGGGFVQDNPAVPARFATGGRVHGPGTGVSDSVNALLSRDEFVVNAAASRPNMAGLEYLNQTGRMPGGGNVTSVAYAPNVSITVEGNSDNAAGNGAQIAKDFEQQMRAQFNEFVAQEQRPGGAFSKTNEDVI